MNTLIHLWIEPLVLNHERTTEKLYFNVIIKGNHVTQNFIILDSLLEGEVMQDIMDFANIESNWNYGSIWSKATNKPTSIVRVDSPEQKVEKETVKKINKEIAKIVTNKTGFKIDKSNVEIVDGGKINVNVPSLRIADTIDFGKIWATLEKDFIGKIQPGDSITLTDDEGNAIFELMGGDFLNIAVSDLGIYDSKKLTENSGLLDKMAALKGGVFLRQDGSLDIGDKERTFYLKIHTGRLLKASLKLKKSLMEITQQKLLK